MKPFKFKLQTSLDLRKRQEDMQKLELAALTKEFQNKLAVLVEMRQQLKQLQDELRYHQGQVIDLSQFKIWQEFVPVMNKKIMVQESLVEESRQAMEQFREVLLETVKARKILEKLMVRYYEEYKREVLREEQKQIDEMATNAYLRNHDLAGGL
ncbi:MAG: flagellar export protein FliJ [Clostridia bacterium]|nr:flagellar export protein FliJ [Clostridia bacterium]